MSWFKVDDKLHSHRKVRSLPRSALGLWVLAGSYCADHMTDGVVEPSDVHWLGGTHEDAHELVEAGLWDVHEDGWRFHDWEDYQPTRAKREAEKAAWRERQQRARTKNDTSSITRPVPSGVTRESRRDTGVTFPQAPSADPQAVAVHIADIRSQLRRSPAEETA